MFLFTIIAEFRGGTYCSQVYSEDVYSAQKEWIKCLERDKKEIKFLGDKIILELILMLNDEDYKFILAKGGRIERILLTFSKDDIADVVFKPIMNDLKQAKGVLINFIIPNEHLNIGDLEKFMLKINEIVPIDTVIIFGVYYDDLKVETFKCDMIISGLPEN